MISGHPAVGDEKVVKQRLFKALFDTGASQTAISQKVARICNPKIVGQSIAAPVATTPKTVNDYAVSLGLIMRKKNGVMQIRNIPMVGYGLYMNNNLFDVIIGLDVICLGTFCISNDGTFEFIL